MPIYEFHCRQCNTVYRFFSRSVNTDTAPSCPRCRSATLRRVMSLFAPLSGRKEGEPIDSASPELDEGKLEKAMSLLASREDRIDEEDPRQTARLMRELSDATGLSLGTAMKEAIRRMERGEDPEKIEAEMGDLLEEEEPFLPESSRGRRSDRPEPKIDETLYEL